MTRLAPLLLLAGCGYVVEEDRSEARLSDGRLPEVAVVPFDTRSFRRGLEVRLTRKVDDELRARSPRAPRAPDSADWLLQGTVVRAEERVLSEDTDDVVRESSFIMTVQVRLENRSSGELLGTYSFTESEPFSDRAGRVATLEQAEEQVLRDLAETIVYWLEESQPREPR
jgi:hypothetical protein